MVTKCSGLKPKKTGQSKFTIRNQNPQPPPIDDTPQIKVFGTFNIQPKNNIGSSDCVFPSFPTPGDVRRMFGTDTINAEPEYVMFPDPAPWAPPRFIEPQAPPVQTLLTRESYAQTSSSIVNTPEDFQSQTSAEVQSRSLMKSSKSLNGNEEMEASSLLITSTEIDNLKKEVLIFALFLASKMNREHWIQFSKVYDSTQSNDFVRISDVENKVKRLAEIILGKKGAREKLLSFNLDGFNNWLEMAKVLLSLYSKGIKSAPTSRIPSKSHNILTQKPPDNKSKYVVKKGRTPARILVKPKTLTVKPKKSKSSNMTSSETMKSNETKNLEEPEMSPTKKILPVKPSITSSAFSNEVAKTKELFSIIEKAEGLVNTIKKKPQQLHNDISVAVQTGGQSKSSLSESSSSTTSLENEDTLPLKNEVDFGRFSFLRALSFGPSKTYLKRFSRSLSGNFIFAEPLSNKLYRRKAKWTVDSETSRSELNNPPASVDSKVFMDEDGDAFVDPSCENDIFSRENTPGRRTSTFSGQTEAEEKNSLADPTSLYKMSKGILVRTTKLSAFLVLSYGTALTISRGIRGEINNSIAVNQEFTIEYLLTQFYKWIENVYGGALHLVGGS